MDYIDTNVRRLQPSIIMPINPIFPSSTVKERQPKQEEKTEFQKILEEEIRKQEKSPK